MRVGKAGGSEVAAVTLASPPHRDNTLSLDGNAGTLSPTAPWHNKSSWEGRVVPRRQIGSTLINLLKHSPH